MTLAIGENLKQLRLRKGLTQEQLAEIFNVSPQAVSRWENGTTHPDITLLPGLAIFYGVSVDDLIGMESIRKADALGKIHADAQSLVREGRFEEAAALLRGGLRVWPGNSGLQAELAVTLAHRTDTPEALEEAVRASERVLGNPAAGAKARGTVSANLVFLYRKAGQAEKAAALVRTLPHFRESREFLEPEALDGGEYSAALAALIRNVLAFLCARTENIPSGTPGNVPDYIQTGFEPDPAADCGRMMEKIRAFLEKEDVKQL